MSFRPLLLEAVQRVDGVLVYLQVEQERDGRPPDLVRLPRVGVPPQGLAIPVAARAAMVVPLEAEVTARMSG